MPGINIYWGI